MFGCIAFQKDCKIFQRLYELSYIYTNFMPQSVHDEGPVHTHFKQRRFLILTPACPRPSNKAPCRRQAMEDLQTSTYMHQHIATMQDLRFGQVLPPWLDHASHPRHTTQRTPPLAGQDYSRMAGQLCNKITSKISHATSPSHQHGATEHHHQGINTHANTGTRLPSHQCNKHSIHNTHTRGHVCSQPCPGLLPRPMCTSTY